MVPSARSQQQDSISSNLASGDYPSGQDALGNSSQDSGIHRSSDESELIKTRQVVRVWQSLQCPYLSLCRIALDQLRQSSLDLLTASSKAETDSLYAISCKAEDNIRDKCSRDPKKGPRPVVVDLNSAFGVPANMLALLDNPNGPPAKCWGFPIGTFNNIKDFDTLEAIKKEFAVPLEVEGQTLAGPVDLVLKTSPPWKIGGGKGKLAYVIAIPIPIPEMPTRSDAWLSDGRNAPSCGVVTMEQPSYRKLVRFSHDKMDAFLRRAKAKDGLAYVEQCLREMGAPVDADKSIGSSSTLDKLNTLKRQVQRELRS
ncbi:hypothetical protein CYLTODRAFT_494304 [Cylindrobasidium torrendii FP15055 ss-10]|uniref:Uncharacterized protein n=1 Tax=Cylindrobasidium torrendii FP15055 ss-10 TaxID=1314674 RepID=A0A0D7AXH8_9AGAR|nr:hypothetical protein CYLTODRAFT_494304 [Cylindrobasidium torrendii FP15055 ss-10]